VHVRSESPTAAPSVRSKPALQGKAGRIGPHALDAQAVLALQRGIGNCGVQQWLASVQRCGGEVHDGCSCAESAEHGPVVARQAVGAASPCNPPGTFRVAGSPADSVAAAVAANCLDEAYAVLNMQPMYSLLPLLDALRGRPEYPTIRSTAAGMGGARMLVAIKTADLHAKGGPLTAAELRDLIDQMGTLPPDQRRDILKFLGKSAVITVQGLDIDFSYCKGATGPGCTGEIKDALAWAKKMQVEYGACRGKGLKTANQVEACVHASLAKQGIGTTVAGSTSSTGTVTVAASPMSQCQPILDRGTEIHESVHHHTQAALQKKHGKGTPAFNKAWEDADNWINDDIKAYGAEIPFYQEVLAAIATLEGKI
jgi:hypothetical protein